MAVQTEAECLLNQGALYKQRVLFRDDHGAPIFAGFKAGAFSLYYGDEPIFHFDLEGRWQRAYLDGHHYLKALDTTIRAIDRVREGANLVLKRRTLSFAEAADLDHRIRQAAIDLIDQLATQQVSLAVPEKEGMQLSSETARDFLEKVTFWDAAAWFAQRERYLAAYPSSPFQPPDGINRVVVQIQAPRAADDVSTFESASPEGVSPFSLSSFEKHANAVARLWGKRSLQSSFVFLGGVDSLRRPHDEVSSCLEVISHVFGIGASASESGPGASNGQALQLKGIHGFLENFSEAGPTVEEWQSYRQRHLERVYLGVESGAPAIRSAFGKQWADEALVETVARLRSARLGISLILLADAGGREHAQLHREATAHLIDRLELTSGDIVGLLEAGAVLGSQSTFAPFTDEEYGAQLALLKESLQPIQARQRFKVVPYSFEKQWM